MIKSGIQNQIKNRDILVGRSSARSSGERPEGRPSGRSPSNQMLGIVNNPGFPKSAGRHHHKILFTIIIVIKIIGVKIDQNLFFLAIFLFFTFPS